MQPRSISRLSATNGREFYQGQVAFNQPSKTWPAPDIFHKFLEIKKWLFGCNLTESQPTRGRPHLSQPLHPRPHLQDT